MQSSIQANNQSKLGPIAAKVIALSFCILGVFSASAQDVTSSEGTWRGGVFSRKTTSPSPQMGLPEATDAARNASWFDVNKVDKSGYTNDVVVLLNATDQTLRQGVALIDPVAARGSRPDLEAAFVRGFDKAIAGSEFHSFFKEDFGQPIAARALIQSSRLTTESRVDGPTQDPQELLHRYIVLRYATTDEASAAVAKLAKTTIVERAVQDFAMSFSSTPTDYYFAPPSGMLDTNYQWGMYAMNFPGSSGAWGRSRGGGYVGAADALTWDDIGGAGLPGYNPANFSSNNSDSNANFRKQLSFRTDLSGAATAAPHGRHVVGIIAAQASNSALGGSASTGVAGGCPNCSLGLGATASNLTSANAAAAAITGLVQRGVQSINLSMNASVSGATCSYGPYICDALNLADARDVLAVIASGNYYESTPRFPANLSTVLPVSAIQLSNPSGSASSSSNWQRLAFTASDGSFFGANAVPSVGVAAPGRNIISTFKPGDDYNGTISCGDAVASDGTSAPRTNFGDGFGTCSGTSMSAPHVTALASLMRSTSPLTKYTDIRYYIQQSGHLASTPSGDLGYGVPNARVALDFLTSTSSGGSRLTPLFSMFSSNRQDYFYTTSPQMGAAAWWGTLEPRANTSFPTNNASTYGTYASVGASVPYSTFPGTAWYAAPGAEAWVFTTPENPLSGTPLAPLFRLSFACNHPASPVAQPTVCFSYSDHMDSTYTTDAAGIAAFQSVGYLLDGLEGYIFPKTVSQPYGTVRLMRKYNSTRDDHAIFPENLLTQYANEGYTQNSGSDWLGYVYPNYGYKPTVQ